MFSQFTKALLALLSKDPIIYGFCKIVPIVMSDEVPTAAVNGRRIAVNPKFWEALDEGSRVFVLAHEALHIAWDFFGRVGGRDAKVFNAAQDIVINEFLYANGFSFDGPVQVMRASMFPTMGYDPAEWTSERVYSWIASNNPDAVKDGRMALSSCGQDPSEGGPDSPPLSPQELEDLRMACQAVVASAPPGTLPQELVKAVESAWVPEYDWRSELSRYFNSIVPDDYSLKKFSMNNLAVSGVLTPTLNSPGLQTIGVILDTSGSMDVFYGEVLAHVRDLLTQVSTGKVFRIDADAAIAFEEETTASSILESHVEFHGGGGTDFRPAIQRMEAHNPDVVLYITDGFGVFPDNPPSYPLVWVDISGTVDYPFGDVVRCKVP